MPADRNPWDSSKRRTPTMPWASCARRATSPRAFTRKARTGPLRRRPRQRSNGAVVAKAKTKAPAVVKRSGQHRQQVRQAEDPHDFHPAVGHADRRGSAVAAWPDGARKTGARPRAQGDHRQAQRRRAGRQHVLRRDWRSTRRFSTSSTSTWSKRRGRRRVGTGAHPPGRVPGKGAEGQEQGGRGHVLPDHRALVIAVVDHGLPARVHRAEIRADFPRHAQRQAAADAHGSSSSTPAGP